MEVILIIVLLVVVLVFFGLRSLLFGDHPLLRNKEDIKQLLTGSSQLSMLNTKTNLKGKIGVVYTVLKPSGKITIKDEQYEATTGGEYIDKGEKVKVIGIGLSNVLKVRKAKEKDLAPKNEEKKPSAD